MFENCPFNPLHRPKMAKTIHLLSPEYQRKEPSVKSWQLWSGFRLCWSHSTVWGGCLWRATSSVRVARGLCPLRHLSLCSVANCKFWSCHFPVTKGAGRVSLCHTEGWKGIFSNKGSQVPANLSGSESFLETLILPYGKVGGTQEALAPRSEMHGGQMQDFPSH